MSGVILNNINTRLDGRTVSVLLLHYELPKELSHRGTFTVTIDALIDWDVPKQLVYLWTLPMFYANGWSYSWGMTAINDTNVCVPKYDASIIYDLIRKHDINHIAPPPTAVLLRTESLGFVVSHGYRLTETGGLVVFCAWKRDWNKLSATEQARLKSRQSLGLTEADVVDPESGLNVKHDESTLGEIVLKGASVMLGYLKDPIATNKCMKKTGDFTPVMLVSCTPMGRGGHG
ncbi:hypothetical protein V6N13_026206 [Hibiscus sabdariffa]